MWGCIGIDIAQSCAISRYHTRYIVRYVRYPAIYCTIRDKIPRYTLRYHVPHDISLGTRRDMGNFMCENRAGSSFWTFLGKFRGEYPNIISDIMGYHAIQRGTIYGISYRYREFLTAGIGYRIESFFLVCITSAILGYLFSQNT